MKKQKLIIVRGGGDLATGTIHRLHGAGFQVLILESEMPAAIRRQVSFCEAVYEGTAKVEGVEAVRIRSLSEMAGVWEKGSIPLLTDPDGQCIGQLQPMAVVDAILAKQNLGTCRSMAPLTIALGPGFTAGVDVDYVVETVRGHQLGRIISEGMAMPNTGIPGNVGGYTTERVLHAPCAGVIHCCRNIGDFVEVGEQIAGIDTGSGEIPVHASISGLLRGMIRNGFPVVEGFKIADIDPRREEYENCFTISDKARCIAGSVLELVCRYCAQR